MVALCATVIASFFPFDDKVDAVVNSHVITRNEKFGAPSVLSSTRKQSEPNSVNEEPIMDPFAPRRWIRPAALDAVPAIVVASLVTEARPEQLPSLLPPALPYRFAGRFVDGSEQIIYLSKGEQIVLAKVGDTLDGQYKVVVIEPRRIDFQHIDSNETQSLSLPATEN